MRRTTPLAVGTALVALLAGCTAARPTGNTTAPPANATTAPAAGRSSGPAPGASGAAPVASWRVSGGFVGDGADTIRPPKLAVYGDGTVIADAKFSAVIATSEVADLVARLTSDLRDPAAGSPRAGAPVIADAPDTVMTVVSADGPHTVTANGLEELRDQNAHRAELYDAHDRLDTLYQRVVKGGQRYVPDRVRVVAMPVPPGSVTNAKPWPSAVAVPADRGGRTRTANLVGDAARTAARLLDEQWRTYQTADGALLSAAWRYLLPDE